MAIDGKYQIIGSMPDAENIHLGFHAKLIESTTTRIAGGLDFTATGG
jgi:hypothetical protein